MKSKLFALVTLTLALPAVAQDQLRGRDQDRLRDPSQSVIQDQARLQDRDQLRDRDPDGQPVYGWQMMTPEERFTFQQQMRNAQTYEEREQLREQHYALMQQRAQERGMTMPGRAASRERGMLGNGPRGGGPSGGSPRNGPSGGPGAGPGGR